MSDKSAVHTNIASSDSCARCNYHSRPDELCMEMDGCDRCVLDKIQEMLLKKNTFVRQAWINP